MDAVRKYSLRFDEWNPESSELSESGIKECIRSLDPRILEDTDSCQSNVRQFAKAPLKTLLSLEVDLRPVVILGHKHIPLAAKISASHAAMHLPELVGYS